MRFRTAEQLVIYPRHRLRYKADKTLMLE